MSKIEVENFLYAKNIPFESYLFSEERNQTTTPIFKTLVLKGNKTGPIIALVPLNNRLDYKKTAKLTKNRKIGLPPIEIAFELTGYPHGANTPVGIFLHHPDYLFLFDATIYQFNKIAISAGERYKGIIIAVDELIKLIQPIVADLLQSE